jgi:hypothetical protein
MAVRRWCTPGCPRNRRHALFFLKKNFEHVPVPRFERMAENGHKLHPRLCERMAEIGVHAFAKILQTNGRK